MAVGMFDAGSFNGDPQAIISFLNRSSFDDLAEIDVPNNRCRNIYHVEGKYFVPVADSPFRTIYRYCSENMVHPDDRDAFRALMDPNTILQRLEASEIPGLLSSQVRYRLMDGTWRWVELYVAGGERHGLPEGILRFYVFDIQNQKNRELGATNTYFMGTETRDAMTRLLVDTAFFQKASETMEAGGSWRLLALDIERFKLFNDWYGRDAGDFLLASIGSLLGRMEDEYGCLAGYLGLDDFALLIPAEADIADQLYDDMCALIKSHGESIGFLPAFGICRQSDGDSILDLYDRAAFAAELAKSQVNHRIRMFEAALYQQTEEEYRILTEFHKALDNGEICFYLQPQCRASTGKIVGVECLARWVKPDGTMIPPVKFIPVLEKHGFVTDLDCYLWDKVCARLRAWMDAGHAPVPISINISQVDIDLIDVVEYLQGLVESHGIPPSLIKAEITESTYANSTDEVKHTAERLREAGFMVMMDDFGSGYSSLNMLRNLAVDVLKLDSFFLNMGDEDARKGIRIVESIVNMAKTMALPIVAEGVETKEQVEFLERLGCRYMQGFHFYRPMPPDQVEHLLDDGNLVDEEGFITLPNEEFRIREFLDGNVYSDTMLNSILGSVALYSWHGDDVDIVRFNEQFFEASGDPEFSRRLRGIQQYLVPGDVPRFYGLLREAERNVLTGSSGIVSTYSSDGQTVDLQLRVFFLGERDSGKLFYASARNVTELTSLQRQMELIARYSPSSIVLLRRIDDAWDFQVVVHGLDQAMGLSRDEFERELNDESFFDRVDARVVERLYQLTIDHERQEESFTFPFQMRSERGDTVSLSVKLDYVEGHESGLSFILTFR